MVDLRCSIAAALMTVMACGDFSNHTQAPMPRSNALAGESSVYLLQHAHNPVDWYPWGQEALERARNENKLLLISIGYSACHWCHVMERETFENDSAAAFMNKHFVSIKVDREERPDIDHLYMDAVQLMTGKGGWPLNCFALPDGRPIYGGTYFSTDNWMQVLQRLVELYETEATQMDAFASELAEGLRVTNLIEPATSETLLSLSQIDELVNQWRQHWDHTRGGSAYAPKFPLPNGLDFLMQYAASRQDAETDAFVELTLTKMARGGIYDQIGGGFARYSVDMNWKVPHFEKMLYDNAQLVTLYCNGWRRYRNEEFRDVVMQTLSFIERELTHERGGFFSALDADSDGEEGKFYTWSIDELSNILGDDYNLAARFFNINEQGHWEDGRYILLRSESPYGSEITQKDRAALDRIGQNLLQARDQRTRPSLDDKQLTAWNALMVSAYCDAWRTFGEPRHLASAEKAMKHLLSTCRSTDGGLYRSWKNDRATLPGYLEDYAAVLHALINLYQCTYEPSWLDEANRLAAYTAAHFRNHENGMFWFTRNDERSLIARKNEVHDNVMPSSNSSMAKALFLLGELLDKPNDKAAARNMLATMAPHIDHGSSYANWLSLSLWLNGPFYVVAITDEPIDGPLRQGLDRYHLPSVVFVGGAPKSIALLNGKHTGSPTLYICIEGACKLPVNTLEDALDQLGKP